MVAPSSARLLSSSNPPAALYRAANPPVRNNDGPRVGLLERVVDTRGRAAARGARGEPQRKALDATSALGGERARHSRRIARQDRTSTILRGKLLREARHEHGRRKTARGFDGATNPRNPFARRTVRSRSRGETCGSRRDRGPRAMGRARPTLRSPSRCRRAVAASDRSRSPCSHRAPRPRVSAAVSRQRSAKFADARGRPSSGRARAARGPRRDVRRVAEALPSPARGAPNARVPEDGRVQKRSQRHGARSVPSSTASVGIGGS